MFVSCLFFCVLCFHHTFHQLFMFYFLILSQIILIAIASFIGLQFKSLKRLALQLSKEVEIKKREIETVKSENESQENRIIFLGHEVAQKEQSIQTLQMELAQKQKEIKSMEELLSVQDEVHSSEGNNVNLIRDIVLPLESIIKNNGADESLITQLKEIQKQSIHLIPFKKIDTTIGQPPTCETKDLEQTDTIVFNEHKSNSVSSKAISIINQHLSEPDFSVEELSSIMGVSRVSLYKRIVAETGDTPIKLIRNQRLAHAYTLLQKKISVNEVAQLAGFNTPKYFIRYFKEKYGYTPQDLQNKI